MPGDCQAYIHFQECLANLNAAWRIVVELQRVPVLGPVGAAAYHMAIIEYAKPFKYSHADGGRRLRLDPPPLSADDQKLHLRLLELRDTVLAHSDLGPKDAKLYVGRDVEVPMPLIIQNTAPLLPVIRNVQGLIQRMLEAFYPVLASLEREL